MMPTVSRIPVALLGVIVVMLASVVFGASPAHATFGLKELGFSFTEEDGSPTVQAGSHPYELTQAFSVNTRPDVRLGEVVPDGSLKDLTIQFPAGTAGVIPAVPPCSIEDFTRIVFGEVGCPDSSAIGIVDLNYAAGGTPPSVNLSALYSLEPASGAILKVGFKPVGLAPIFAEIHLNPNPPYNPIATVHNASDFARVYGVVLHVWGNPFSHSHDSERGHCIGPKEGCSVPETELPFLIAPRSCTGPLVSVFEADSWQDPSDVFREQLSTSPGLSGCSSLGFAPHTSAAPTGQSAASGSGLDFHVDVSDEGLTSPTGIANSDIKKTVVTLPEGMTANPSLAEGLETCSEDDLARETINSEPGQGCPQASKIGEVEVESPLLPGVLLKGSVFIASQDANLFHSLLALYIVIKEPKLGIMLKLPGKVEPDLQTGRLVTTFGEAPYELPQLPFSHFRFHFREGARAPLITPPACGTYDIKTVLSPWSGAAPVTTTSSFQITSGINGGACPSGGVPPFAPEATTGTLNNDAGNYSPLDLRISRKDGEQELTRFSTTLPSGLTGNLSGIPFCPDSAIEAARGKTGTQEINEPSCPATSEIGHTLVGAGVGDVLAWAPGKVYLAGPYNGSPLSVVSITSAKVGPFDLGTVVIRFGLHIDPDTARVNLDSTGSDPIPHIIKGIVVHVREIHAYIDRGKFILNPTNCNPTTLQNTITGAGTNLTSPTDDVTVTLNNPFQAASCGNLNFKPSFQVSTSGKTSKANGASLTVKLAYPNAPQGTQANIRKVKVDLPKQLPSRLTTLQKACTSAQFHTNPAGCPAASVVGHARAITPILPVPLEGPAYFVSNGGEAFPNLIMVLQGYGITIDLTGDTFINKAGITSSTFPAIPDQPVTSFELILPEGPHSALAANGNLCTSKLTTPNEFTGQNGTTFTQNTKVTITGCPKTKTLTRAQKLALALKPCHKKPKGAKRSNCEHQAHKKYGPPKKKAKKAKR
ncbi:MAG: hypothetical protein WB709_12530 [Solirubrobacteraceae bacterium]